MKPRNFKRIWGKPYDWHFLINLEQAKLKEMSDYFEKEDRFVGVEKVVKDIRLCIKLIDIICEKDKYYLSWLHENFTTNKDIFSDNYSEVSFPKHVNTRNANRFLRPHNFLENCNKKIYQSLLVEYRRTKALHLYNKIKTYKLFSWWS